jgi:hypothetical protein
VEGAFSVSAPGGPGPKGVLMRRKSKQAIETIAIDDEEFSKE